MMDLGNLRYLKSPGSILLFVRVFISLIVIDVLLSILKLQSLLKIIDRKGKRRLSGKTIENVTLFSDFILYRIFRTRRPCTLRSLLVFRYMRSMGQDIKIVFGVKDDQGELKGHAWILKGKTPFLEKSDPSEQYEIMHVYPPSGNTGI